LRTITDGWTKFLCPTDDIMHVGLFGWPFIIGIPAIAFNPIALGKK